MPSPPPMKTSSRPSTFTSATARGGPCGESRLCVGIGARGLGLLVLGRVERLEASGCGMPDTGWFAASEATHPASRISHPVGLPQRHHPIDFETSQHLIAPIRPDHFQTVRTRSAAETEMLPVV